MDKPAFDDENLAGVLAQSADADLDELGFGVVKMDLSGVVAHYNRYESDNSGLSPQRVVGRDFFVEVAPCAHNYLVAQRLFDADSIDATVDYVFTWRLTRTPVRLRLLKSVESSYMYLLVKRRSDGS